LEPQPYVCAAVEYGGTVHSDICPLECRPDQMSRAEWRRFLHANLDEWLDKSNGTGHFAIGGNEFWATINKGSE
jgi:hypothetical protein